MKKLMGMIAFAALFCPARIGWAQLPNFNAPMLPRASALITIIVPSDAEVFFDGTPTAQKGVDRLFSTPLLQPGWNYSYAVSARWQDRGKVVEQTRNVVVSAGAGVRVDFLTPPPAER
jgi:uncharacterized protein (TIGR03000 family)